MNSTRSIFTVCTALLVTSASYAQVTKSVGGYLFRIKFTKGSVVRYQTHVRKSAAPGSNSQLDVLFPIVQTVLGVRGDNADIQVKSGPISINNQPIGVANSFQMKVSNRGQLVGGSIGASSGITVFPAHAVHPGQTWTATIPLAAAGAMTGGPATVTATYKFLRVVDHKGKPSAELGVTFDSRGKARIRGAGVTYVLAKDGIVYSSTLKMDVTLSAGAEPLSVNVSVDRF